MGDAFVCGEKEIALSLWDAAVAAAAAHQAVACCLHESWIFEFTTARPPNFTFWKTGAAKDRRSIVYTIRN